MGCKTRDGLTVFDKDKGDVLVPDAVDAVGEVASRFGYGDRRTFHKIRLSDYAHVGQSQSFFHRNFARFSVELRAGKVIKRR